MARIEYVRACQYFGTLSAYLDDTEYLTERADWMKCLKEQQQ